MCFCIPVSLVNYFLTVFKERRICTSYLDTFTRSILNLSLMLFIHFLKTTIGGRSLK